MTHSAVLSQAAPGVLALIGRTPLVELRRLTVAPTDTLRIAYTRMRSADVSQLPVLDRGRLVGLVDESDLLRVISAAGGETREAFGRPVYEAMATRLATLPAHAPITDLPAIFAADQVAIVVEDKRFLGLVTRVDLLNFLLRSDL